MCVNPVKFASTEVLELPETVVGVTARVFPRVPETVPHRNEIAVVTSELASTDPDSFAVVVPMLAEVGAAEVTVGAPFRVIESVLPRLVP